MKRKVDWIGVEELNLIVGGCFEVGLGKSEDIFSEVKRFEVGCLWKRVWKGNGRMGSWGG